jgi:hypothetical protein
VAANGRLTESITAFGKAWNFDAVTNEPWDEDGWGGLPLTSVPRYASGPCAGRAAGDCEFETRAFYSRGTALVESITAYGKAYNFDALTYAPWDGTAAQWPANGTDLTAVPRYAMGPCASRPEGQCYFQSRTFYASDDGRLVESITAQGRLWEFDTATDEPLVGNWSGTDLTAVPRFARGPCAGVKEGACVITTRTYLVAANNRATESLTD